MFKVRKVSDQVKRKPSKFYIYSFVTLDIINVLQKRKTYFFDNENSEDVVVIFIVKSHKCIVLYFVSHWMQCRDFQLGAAGSAGGHRSHRDQTIHFLHTH